MSGSKRKLEVDFLRRGSLMGLGSALGGVRGLVTLVALSAFGPMTISMYGIALSVYGIAVVLCAGHSVAVISRLSRYPVGGEPNGACRTHFTEIVATAWASTIALVMLTFGFGVISAMLLPLHSGQFAGPEGDATGKVVLLPIDVGQFAVAYAAATVGAVLLPLGQCLVGRQQVLGLERVSTVHSLETFAIGTGLALIGIHLAPNAETALAAIGAGGLCAEIWGFVRRRNSLDAGDHGIIRAGLVRFASRPRRAFRGVPRTAAGGYDGIVLLSAFAVVSQLAFHVSPLTGAVTVTAIAFLRSIVVPLKSVGLVGGRLVVQGSAGNTIDASLIRRVIGAVACLLVPAGAVIALAPWPLQHLLGLPPGPDVELVIRLVGVQLMLEPVTGVGSAMLKIIVKPTTVLLPLVLCMWGFALPMISISTAMHASSLLSIWTILLTARIAFCVCVLFGLVRTCAPRAAGIA